MRRLRTLSILLFIISVLVFGLYLFKEKILKDQTGPVFQADSNSLLISVNSDASSLLNGLTAEDKHDGDVTDSIIVETVSPFTGTGHRIVKYAAFDSDNHVTHTKREIIYTDYYAPKFSISKPLSFPLNSTNLLEGVGAQDCIDGDISRNIRMMSEEEIDTSHVGNYSARLKVSNSAGGVSYLPVTIEIYDSSVHYKMPQIKLNEQIVYIERGTDFDEEDYIDNVTIGGIEYEPVNEGGTYGANYIPAGEKDKTINFDEIDIKSDVDTDVTGCYEVVYSIYDSVNGTGSGTSRLYVVVSEGVFN